MFHVDTVRVSCNHSQKEPFNFLALSVFFYTIVIPYRMNTDVQISPLFGYRARRNIHCMLAVWESRAYTLISCFILNADLARTGMKVIVSIPIVYSNSVSLEQLQLYLLILS